MAYVRTGGRGHPPDPQLEKEIGEYHIGSLWGFMRADPWTQRTLHTGLNPSLAARASNRLQSYVIEHSRLGIPLFLAEECPHGHMAIGTTVFPTSIGQASTWNPELIRQMGRVIAIEASAQEHTSAMDRYSTWPVIRVGRV